MARRRPEPPPEHIAEDAFLRSYGWRVHARPRRGEAVWRHEDGRLVGHAAAVAEQAQREREMLRLLQEEYP